VPYRAFVLRPAAESPRLARKVVLGWLLDLGMEEVAEKVLLIASELVANAALHAHTVLEISMSTSSRSVKLGVRDDDRHLPRLDGPDGAAAHGDNRGSPLTESGRGLAIVEGLADEWGVDVLRGGKRVWARVLMPQRCAR
jgi:anti-sigma regulatory factor (Ser/Thr protein kinase)